MEKNNGDGKNKNLSEERAKPRDKKLWASNGH